MEAHRQTEKVDLSLALYLSLSLSLCVCVCVGRRQLREALVHLEQEMILECEKPWERAKGSPAYWRIHPNVVHSVKWRLDELDRSLKQVSHPTFTQGHGGDLRTTHTHTHTHTHVDVSLHGGGRARVCLCVWMPWLQAVSDAFSMDEFVCPRCGEKYTSLKVQLFPRHPDDGHFLCEKCMEKLKAGVSEWSREQTRYTHTYSCHSCPAGQRGIACLDDRA